MGLSLTHKKIDGGLEKICAFLQTKGAKPLSKTLEKRLDKIDFVDNLIRNGNSPKQVLVYLQKRFKEDEISRATAYRYIADAKYVYGTINRESKDYWRGVLIDLILETRRLARRDQDYKVMASCEANLFRALGLDKEDQDLPQLDKIQPPVQIYQIQNNFIEKYGNILPEDVLKAAKKLKIKAKEDES